MGLAGGRRSRAGAHVEAGHIAEMGPAERLGERRADEPLVVVRGLLPAEDEVGLQVLDRALERVRDAERAERLRALAGHKGRVVTAHREGLAQRVLRSRAADGDDADDGVRRLVLVLERELDRVLVVWRDGPGDA